MNEPSKTLDSRLARQAQDSFVGRDAELEDLCATLGEASPFVAYLYGIAGVGKSTLMRRFVARAEENGATGVLMDCRLVEPTVRGFLGELSRLVGEDITTVEEAGLVLGGRDHTVILGLDHYENFLLMDTWLRQDFLPRLPDNFRLVVASRQPPAPLWMTDPAWHGLFRAQAVEPLSREASLELLEKSGIDPDQASQLAAVTHGNPLALKLAAGASGIHGRIPLQDAAIQDVMENLTGMFLADVGDADTRDAVRYTSVTRRITRSLLRALGFTDERLFDTLRQLPFVDALRDGLRTHDAVREALARTLRAGDPERYHQCRREVWAQLRRELNAAPRADIWRYTADMLYLIENPVVREAFFPSGHQELGVEPARREDKDEILAIARRQEGPDGAAALELWWNDQPGAYHVVRNREGVAVGFHVMCLADELTESVRKGDPVARAWAEHLETERVPEGGRALFLRRWLAAETGEAPSAEQAASWLDIKRTYMELRPALRRVYLPVIDLPTYAPVATKLGFQHLPDSSVALDSAAYQTAMLDFGPSSVDGWLTRLVGDELGVGDQSPLDHDQKALVIDGNEIPLTPLEYKLAEHLEAQAGTTVTRDQLLAHVWGHGEGSGSSNVVDAVVKSLRRKLGTESGLIETVRGFGYRWSTD